MPKGRLTERVTKFCAGEWIPLLEASMGGRSGWKVCPGQATTTSERQRSAGQRELLGWRSWESSQVHVKRWKVQRLLLVMRRRGRPFLMRPKRPRRQRHPLEEEVLTVVPPDPLVLDIELLMKTLRSAQQGSAGGPSGMTVEHLRPLLKSGVCTQRCWEKSPPSSQGVKFQKKLSLRCGLGRMTALQKPDGAVLGIVVGDVFRWLVGRTLAKQFAEQGQAPTHIFQCVLSTVHARNVLHTLCRRLPVSIQVPQSCPS